MRIALDISKASSLDGLGTWIRELTRSLAKLETDHEWWLVDLLDQDGEQALEALGPLGERFLPKLSHRQLSGEVDVLLASTWSMPEPAPPTLFVAYDLTVFSHPDCHTLANRLHVSEGLLRANLSGARFLAISQATALELERWLGAAPEAIDVITPGLGQEYVDRARDSEEEGAPDAAMARVRERFDLSPDAEGFILSVGSFEPRKNLARLLSAHETLGLETRLRFPLLMAGGSGWRSESLEARLQEQPEKSVSHLGPLSTEELMDLYSAATLFVYPSLAEGFGLPPLEAMACGTPVITSGRSSLPEVVGDAATLVDPTDVTALSGAIETLLHDPEARRLQSQLGLRRAGSHSWLESARLTLQSLEKVASVSLSPIA